LQARLVASFYLRLQKLAGWFRSRTLVQVCVMAEYSLLQFLAGVALERGWQFIGGSIIK